MNVEQIKEELLKRYDYILKLDAIRYIKSISPCTKINDIIAAYNLAYDD